MEEAEKDGILSGKEAPRCSPGKLAFIVDGQDYFELFANLATQARRSIFISGWTLDSRTSLLINARGGSELKLSAFLSSLIEKNEQLQIHILVWDFVGIYKNPGLLLRRPVFHLPWLAPQNHRLRILRDSVHPIGSVYHRSFVVIDDAVAFIGSTDFIPYNWDTCEHRMDDHRRFSPDNKPYGPLHSVQAMLEGPLARHLGDLFRERWQASSGERLPEALEGQGPYAWPHYMLPGLSRGLAALALTAPGEPAKKQVREIERVYLKAIAVAEKYIYIEDQYLTASSVIQALAASLRQPAGPEVVIVTSKEPKSWVVEWSMGFLRDLSLDMLFRSDRHERLALFYPVFRRRQSVEIEIKSNLMIVDDKLAILGSAHLNNRSMTLDMECDLAVESAGREETEQALAGLRSRLLAEHLGSDPDKIAAETRQSASLSAVINKHHHKIGRALVSMRKPVLPFMQNSPKRRVPLENLLASLVRASEWPQRRRALIIFFCALLALVSLMYLWGIFIPDEYLDPERLIDNLGALAAHPAAPWALILITVLAGALLVPMTIFILLAGALFDPLSGGLVAVTGIMANSALMYCMGLYLKPSYLRRLGGPKAARLSRRITQNTFWVVFALRAMPIIPFQLVSLASGVARLPLKSFLLATLAGIIPYIALLIFLAEQIKAMAADPSPYKVSLLIAILLILLLTGSMVIRRMEKWSRKPKARLFASDE